MADTRAAVSPAAKRLMEQMVSASGGNSSSLERLSAANARIRKLENQLALLTQTVDESRKATAKSQEESQSLTKRLAAVERNFDKVEVENAELRDELASAEYKGKYESVRAADRDMLGKVLKAERAEFLAERRVFSRRYEKLEKRMTQMSALQESLLARITGLRNLVSLRERELERVRSDQAVEKRAWIAELTELRKTMREESQLKHVMISKSLQDADPSSPHTKARASVIQQVVGYVRMTESRNAGGGRDELSILERALERIQEITSESDIDAALRSFAQVDDTKNDLVARLHHAATENRRLTDEVGTLRRELEAHSRLYEHSTHKKVAKLELRVHALEAERAATAAASTASRRTAASVRAAVMTLCKTLGVLDEALPFMRDGISDSNVMSYVGLLEERIALMLQRRGGMAFVPNAAMAASSAMLAGNITVVSSLDTSENDGGRRAWISDRPGTGSGARPSGAGMLVPPTIVSGSADRLDESGSDCDAGEAALGGGGVVMSREALRRAAEARTATPDSPLRPQRGTLTSRLLSVKDSVFADAPASPH